MSRKQKVEYWEVQDKMDGVTDWNRIATFQIREEAIGYAKNRRARHKAMVAVFGVIFKKQYRVQHFVGTMETVG